MALALGAKTHKMDRGHRGANHPVKDLATGKIEITSQNHGFVVNPDSLPAELEVSHISLFDQSVEGLRHTSKPAFCVQYHPESSPGPHDSRYLFERFIDLMEKTKA
jgi:carbamoyl-phosphate synthase small subunit